MKNKLKELLSELHTELGDAGELDTDAKQQLEVLAKDIQGAIDPDSDKPLLEDVSDQLQVAAVNFESEHPRIAGVLENITDTLAKLGI
ncbi:MAG: DUF4404 family protein [Gammaproteobacteria bacterium]|nr:DUF4404 family protein [Gammaproteobacteria bacterium]MCP4089595.1 DUF4404 family protein [Gammaproteobacteria bacterium]MCP4278070.1 DUF4404 family protein [Gammaproteobacteria bacterium]MCP4832486.1 DUF4404 family protein [Gammaproteobacteria bacterium]MCP4930178.1 DUF4404 family protein [Gammaproteobacteria bacterium]